MLTWKIAVRNIFRQKRRTILTVLTMLGGFTLASISIAWSDGTYNNIIDLFTRNRLGHIQVHRAGYLDRPSLYKTIDNYQAVGERIQHVEGVESWAPRVYSPGLGSVGDKSAGVQITGIDPQREDRTTRFMKKIVEGKTLSPTPQHESVVGKGLARILKAGVGDTVVVVSQGADGSIANDLYAVVGIAESGDEANDQSAFYLHIRDAQDLLVLDDRAHEIVIIADHLKDVPHIASEITSALADSTLAVAPWQEFAHSFYTAMKADQQGSWIMIFVIVLLVGVGVLNTVLMAVMERRREYGLLRAVGTRPGQIVRLVLAETAVMAILSIVVGIAISLLANYLLSIKGINIPTPMTYGGVEFKTMKTELNARSYYIPMITVFLTAVFVSIFPSLRAAHVAPARVMRMQ
jgi:putative ABC transport system permease protein